jgi:hypothetical protein
MSLRTQIFVYVVAVMAIVFTLVVATLLPDWVMAKKFNVVLGREAAGSLQAMFEQMTSEQRDAMVREQPKLFVEQSILEGWILTTDSGTTLGSRFSRNVPEQLNEDFITRANFDYVSHFSNRSGEAMVLYARSNSHLLGPSVDLGRIFLVMAIGTVLLLVVLYSLLLRLIVKPVERLATIGNSPAIARGLIPQVPNSQRRAVVLALGRA